MRRFFVLSAILMTMMQLAMISAGPLICLDEHGKSSTGPKSTICFDMEHDSVTDPLFKQRNIYQTESARNRQSNVVWGGLPKKPRACKGYNFYRRCAEKYQSETDQFECRYARCTNCVVDSFEPHCPFCRHDKSLFCPAIEACVCPWKAGFGVWESCRRISSSMCGFQQNGLLQHEENQRRRQHQHRHHKHHHRRLT